MVYETIDVRKLSPIIGAEIHGIDLSQPLSLQQFDEISDAWRENLVIFFRDQHLTMKQHLDFGRRFGELHIHPAVHLHEKHPEILVVETDENSKRAAGEEWHTDVSCEAEPPMGSLLYMTTVPPDGGGDTMFANMYRAYETLSEPVKAMIGGLDAVHDGRHVFGGQDTESGDFFRKVDTYPRAAHPMVRTHPVTGRPALFVNRVFTTHIVGLSRNESDAILQMLYRHLETPEFCVRFNWRPNSLACWDNRCTQHRALFDYFPHRRYAQRVTVKGDKPFRREGAASEGGCKAEAKSSPANVIAAADGSEVTYQ